MYSFKISKGIVIKQTKETNHKMIKITNKNKIIKKWIKIYPVIMTIPIKDLKEEIMLYFIKITKWIHFNKTRDLDYFENELIKVYGTHHKGVELRNSIRIYHLSLLYKDNLIHIDNSLSNPLLYYLNRYYEITI